MLFIQTDGLMGTEINPKGLVPMFLTDTYEIIEGPSYWAMHIAGENSRSIDTLKQYTSTVAGFLQWLDDEAEDEDGAGANAWARVDRSVIKQYIAYLIEERDEFGRPNDSTIETYIARLEYFYKWAKKAGYRHYWKFEQDKKKKLIKDSETMVTYEYEYEARSFHLQKGKPTRVDREREKFILKENLPAILRSFDDVVYALIALIIWRTGLRPKEIFQLPYLGVGLNAGLRRYRGEELKDLEPIMFDFESKGKDRSINFPPDLWAFICRVWMPLWVERAEKYKKKHGVTPPIGSLFLSKEGRVVTRKMLRDNFNKAAEKETCPENKLNPYKFRHAFATYFVLDRLKALNHLGKDYAYNPVIDDELREWMGHAKSETTYKYYVHLCNRYLTDDLLSDLEKKENKKLFDAIIKM